MAGPVAMTAKTVLKAVGSWMGSDEGKAATTALLGVIASMGDKKERLGAIKMLASQKEFEAKAFREILVDVEGDSIPKDAIFGLREAVSEQAWASVKKMADLDSD